jgi:uncharacterized protein YbjT (DUF2867 family)
MTRIAVAGATGRAGRHTVDVLHGDGHDVVAISRSNGVDVITGDGLAAALAGVEVVIDVTTGPSPEQEPATEFFTTATRNLQEAGVKAGVRRLVAVSIIGVDKSAAGYGAAKLAHERAALAGPIPARILRAAQFHELVEMLMKIEAVSHPDDPDDVLGENGGLLPGPHAKLAGPTFAEWLNAAA